MVIFITLITARGPAIELQGGRVAGPLNFRVAHPLRHAKGGALDSSFSASGNATNDGFNTLVGVYPERSRRDAENHAVSVSNAVASAAYTYDANGSRVQKAVTGGTTTVYIFSGSKVIAEYDNGAAVGSPSREYIYSGGTLLAKIENSATVYYHQDGLSTRIMTDSSGNKLTPNGDQGHYPFGELWYPASALTKWLFTTYERDAESGGSDGNDYAMARFYRDALGRFNSPDPLSGSIGDPQSLDRYSYAQNDPIDLTDPSGECIPPDTYRYYAVQNAPACQYGGGGGMFAEQGADWFFFAMDMMDLALTVTSYNVSGDRVTPVYGYAGAAFSALIDSFGGGDDGSGGGGGGFSLALNHTIAS